jgi:phage-related baseplate assembly protein
VNAYPYAANTPGKVDVYCEAITDVDPDGYPTGAMLDDVLATINQDESGLANRRPVNAKVTTRCDHSADV